MLQVTLTDLATGKAYHVEPGAFSPNFPNLVVTNEALIHGSFKSVSRTTAGTTIIAEPDVGGSIILTDIIVSTDKTAGSSVTIRFTDGTNTIVVMKGDSVNAPFSIAIPLAGKWQGWKDARLEVVTVSTVDATVAAGYYKVASGLAFETWDAMR